MCEKTASRSLPPGGRVKKQTSQGRGLVKPKTRRSALAEKLNFDSEDGQKSHASDSKAPKYACPYYKLAPVHNMDCMTCKMTRLRDVRQHILRRHAPTHLSTYHQTSKGFDQTFSFTSQFNSKTHVEDEKLEKLLSHRVNPKSPLDKQWYELWHLLLPNHRAPQSPYIGSVVSEAAGLICEFWTQESPEIAPAFRQLKGTSDAGDENFSQLLNFVADKFQTKVDQGFSGINRSLSGDIALASRASPPPSSDMALSVHMPELSMDESSPESATSSGCTTPHFHTSPAQRPRAEDPVWFEDLDRRSNEPRVYPILIPQVKAILTPGKVDFANSTFQSYATESDPFPLGDEYLGIA